MNKIMLSAILFSAFALSACDNREKSPNIKTLKKIYNAMTDQEIKDLFSKKITDGCMNNLQANLGSTQMLQDINLKSTCQCLSKEVIAQLDIESLRLGLLPESELNAEQKRQVERNIGLKSAQLMPEVLPKCLQ